MNSSYFPLFLFNLFLFPALTFSQKITIEGKVISLDTKEPLPDTIIEIKALQTGTYTDDKGYFILSIPEKNLQDTLDVYCLGYEKKTMKMSELTSSGIHTIELINKVVPLKEVVIKPKKSKTILVGSTETKPWSKEVVNILGAQKGCYLANKKGKTGRIKAVSYYIFNLGFTNAPFRVRIYSFDKVKKCPGADLLKENVIVSDNNGPGWFKVNLTQYNLEFPKDGLYAMMEWIYSVDQYYYDLEVTRKSKDGKSEKKEILKLYGPVLGALMKQKEGYISNRGLGTNWQKFDLYYKGYVML